MGTYGARYWYVVSHLPYLRKINFYHNSQYGTAHNTVECVSTTRASCTFYASGGACALPSDQPYIRILISSTDLPYFHPYLGVRRNSYKEVCGVAQLVGRRLAVSIVRVHFSARHPREVNPTVPLAMRCTRTSANRDWWMFCVNVMECNVGYRNVLTNKRYQIK